MTKEEKLIKINEYLKIEDIEHDSFKSNAIKSGSYVFISRIIQIIVQVVSAMILARLLSVNDYGIFAMINAITNFFIVFRDLGLTDATIQTPELNSNQVNTLFWTNILFGTLCTLILIGLTPAIVWFYKEPRLTWVVIISATTFFITSLSIQHNALIKRKMNFKLIAIINTICVLISNGLAILLAFKGFSYWALVYRPIIFAVILIPLSWVYCPWRPKQPSYYPGSKSLLKFGFNSIGFYIINYFSKSIDKILLGKKYGADDLGYYHRGYYFSALPSDTLSFALFHVGVSTLSKLRNQPDKYFNYYFKTLSALSFVAMPISAFMTFCSKDLIFILLGPKWEKTVIIFMILSIGAGFRVIYTTFDWLHVSLGRADRRLYWGIISSLCIIIGFFIGIHFGALGLSIANVLIIILLTFPAIKYAGKPIKLKINKFILLIFKYFLAAFLSGLLIYYLMNTFLVINNIFLRFLTFFILYGLIYLLFTIIIFLSFKPITDFYKLVKIAFLKK